MFFGVALAVFILQRTIGLENMQGYKAVNNTNNEKTVSFFDGLMLIINKPYVLAIFGIVFFQEFVSTIMSFQLQLLTTITYQDPGLVTKFLFDFALWVQIISCAFALFGTSFFQRKLGIEISLVAYPLLLGILIFIYILYPTLHSIFYVMLFAKALGYALNQPTKEALYIPTSKSIKYKSKAWIDMFGMRFAKSTGSGFNKLIGPALLFSNALTLGVIAIWIFFASALGKRFKKVITKNRLIE
jgi:AAA family ATP:ADP antiporter